MNGSERRLVLTVPFWHRLARLILVSVGWLSCSALGVAFSGLWGQPDWIGGILAGKIEFAAFGLILLPLLPWTKEVAAFFNRKESVLVLTESGFLVGSAYGSSVDRMAWTNVRNIVVHRGLLWNTVRILIAGAKVYGYRNPKNGILRKDDMPHYFGMTPRDLADLMNEWRGRAVE